MLSFVEASAFTGQIDSVMEDDEYARFQRELAADPSVGDPIRGLGGLRKVRWSARGKGKRGGARRLRRAVGEIKAEFSR